MWDISQSVKCGELMNNEMQLHTESIVDSSGVDYPLLSAKKELAEEKASEPVRLGKKTFWPVEFVIERLIQVTAFFSLACIILIFIFVFREASSIFVVKEKVIEESVDGPQTYGEEALGGEILEEEVMLQEESQENLRFKNLLGNRWIPVSLNPQYGLIPLLLGSFNVALIALLIAAPISIFAALYTSTFAPKKIKEVVKPVVEILGGFPSVVIGFFALIIIASLAQQIFGLQYRLNALVGGIALSLAIIPVIFTISEDALNAVPHSYIEASLALGAQKWETALFVVLPSAMPGIFAALLLGMGRAIGETMIVLMATGNAAIATINPFSPVRTMAATIGAEMAEVVFGDVHYSVLFFIGALLFVISFLLNFTAETVVRKLVMRRYS